MDINQPLPTEGKNTPAAEARLWDRKLNRSKQRRFNFSVDPGEQNNLFGIAMAVWWDTYWRKLRKSRAIILCRPQVVWRKWGRKTGLPGDLRDEVHQIVTQDKHDA